MYNGEGVVLRCLSGGRWSIDLVALGYPRLGSMGNEKEQKTRIGETLRTARLDDGDAFQTGMDVFNTFRDQAADSFEISPNLIPGFEILQELGRGAFGVVYQARDIHLDRMVAIKISLIDEPRLREQYIKEAKNAAKLECHGIVPVYQVGTLSSGRPFVVQRFIDGGSLRALLNRAGVLDFQQTCTMIIDISKAIAKAHAAGLVHRDIKPDNILIDSQGKPWLADFGLAIPENEQRKHRGEKAGTPLYMSPEQLLGRADWLDGRSDIYALGVMMYEMLIGRTPFYAKDFEELREQILNRDAKPISQRSPNIPAVMDIIFENCCAKKVQDRYSNAYELASDLEAAIQENPQVDTQVGVASRGGVSSRMSVQSRISRRSHRSSSSNVARPLVQSDHELPKSNKWIWPVSSITSAAVIIGLFLIWQAIQPGRQELGHQGSGSQGAGGTEINGQTGNGQRHDVQAGVETKPPDGIRVGKGPQSTHTTIQQAIKDAPDGATIVLLPGEYSENLTIDKSLTFVGEGNRDDVRVIGQNAPAMVIQSENTGQLVHLKNVSVDVDTTADTEFNTIELKTGKLDLADCSLRTRTFDCIKMAPQTSLTAVGTRFRSAGHPAISLDSATAFNLSRCEFDIVPLPLNNKIASGIQAKNSPGDVDRCVFRGTGTSTAIHWQNSEQKVNLNAITVENCTTGVLVSRCSDVVVTGDGNLPTIAGSDKGILADSSKISIQGVRIFGNNGTVGIGLSGKSTPRDATVRDSDLEGFSTGLSVLDIGVDISKLSVTKCSIGWHLDRDAKVVVRESTIENCTTYGLDCRDATLKAEACIIAKCDSGALIRGHSQVQMAECTIENNTLVGIGVCSGKTELLEGTKVLGNLAGLVVMMDPYAPSDAAPPTESQVEVDIVGNTFKSKPQTAESECVILSIPCRYRIENSQLSSQPTIKGKLSSNESDDGWTVIRAKPNT